MQLASKMRFLAVQFDALLGGDLWRRNAAHANAMARRLADAVSDLDGVELAYPVQANGVFATLPAPAIERLRDALPAAHPFYVWDEAAGTIRLMCSWDTTEDDVDGLASPGDRGCGLGVSAENLEILRRGYEHLRRYGRAARTRSCDPEFVWDMSTFRNWPERQTYEGVEGMRRSS